MRQILGPAPGVGLSPPWAGYAALSAADLTVLTWDDIETATWKAA